MDRRANIDVLGLWRIFTLMGHLYHMVDSGSSESGFSILCLPGQRQNDGTNNIFQDNEGTKENKKICADMKL